MIVAIILLSIYCLATWYVATAVLFVGLGASGKGAWLLVAVAPILAPVYLLLIALSPPKDKEGS